MTDSGKKPGGLHPSFIPLGIWAFSIGTSIGWGSFIVTCNTYLKKSGIPGTVFGLLIGMAVILMIIILMLLLLMLFASMMWVSRATENAANTAVEQIYEYHQSHPDHDKSEAGRQVFRIGGDEFATLLTDADYKHRDKLIRQFDKKCEEKRTNDKGLGDGRCRPRYSCLRSA